MTYTDKFYIYQVTDHPLDDERDVINIIGPFETTDDAADYGATNYAPGGPDDPRWNVIRGASVQYLPADLPWEKGAYPR